MEYITIISKRKPKTTVSTSSVETAGARGAVTTVYGRIGQVIAIDGDYTASQITYLPSSEMDSDINDVQTAIDNIYSLISTGTGLVNSIYGRTGDVVAEFGDYTASQIIYEPISGGGLIADNVQAAIEELDAEKLYGYSDASNTRIGLYALPVVTTGLHNTAGGYNALSLLITGSNNTAYGHGALQKTTGSGSTAIGYVAGINNTSGGITAVGYYALQSNTTGVCTAMGNMALAANTTGINSAFGYEALKWLNTGSYTMGIGTGAGCFRGTGVDALTSSSQSTYLGEFTRGSANGVTNEIAIGYNTVGGGSNTVTLGNSSITTTILRGIVQTAGSVKTNIIGEYTGGSGVIIEQILINDSEISNVGSIAFDLTPASSIISGEGIAYWDIDAGTVALGMPGGSVNLQLGQEMLLRCKNETSSIISNGSVVYISGASGQRPEIDLANASSYATSYVVGIATEDIATTGYITMSGLVHDVDTGGMTEGLPIWLDTTSGGFSQTRPTAPNMSVFLGYVVYAHATEGIIAINPTLVPRLQGLSDVYGTPTDGQILAWVAANSRFEYTSATGYWTRTGTVLSPTTAGDTIKVNAINEETSANGVFIDGLQIKDYGLYTPNGTISSVAGQDINITAGSGYDASGGVGGNINLIAGDSSYTGSSTLGGAIYLVPGYSSYSSQTYYVVIGNSTKAGSRRRLTVDGSATDIALDIYAKGTGGIVLGAYSDGASVRVHGLIVSNISSVETITRSNTNIVAIDLQGGVADVAGSHEAGDMVIRGGSGASGGSSTYMNGGDVFIYGGVLADTGTNGNVYFGTRAGTAMLPVRSSETNIIHYDTSTGKISYGGYIATNFQITSLGGYAVKLIAGENLYEGEVVYVDSAGSDSNVKKAPTSNDMPIGVVYANATSGNSVWVVVAGLAYVLPETGITATRGYVIYTSANQAGKVEQASTVPVEAIHFREVGHFVASGSGAGVKTLAVIHFN